MQMESVQGEALLVTGASGYLGSRLVPKLLEHQRSLVTFYRFKNLETFENAYPFCSDLTSEDLLAAPLRGINTVVHLAWNHSISNRSFRHKELSEDNLFTAQNLIRAMENNKTQRFIFISASGACADATNQFLREKYLVEQMVINSKIPHKTIIRLPPLYSGGGSGDRLYNAIKNLSVLPWIFPCPKQVNKSMSLLSVEDAAEGLKNIVLKAPKESCSLVDFSCCDRYGMKDIVKKTLKTIDSGVRIPIYNSLGRSLLRFLEKRPKAEGETVFEDYLELCEKTQPGFPSGVEEATSRDFLPRKLATLKDTLKHQI